MKPENPFEEDRQQYDKFQLQKLKFQPQIDKSCIALNKRFYTIIEYLKAILGEYKIKKHIKSKVTEIVNYWNEAIKRNKLPNNLQVNREEDCS